MTASTLSRTAVTSAPIHSVLAERWSPRSFDPSVEIAEEKITAALEAARWSASASNSQPWRFIVARRGTAEHATIVENLVGFNQTWEAKLKRPPRRAAADSAAAALDTVSVGDTLAARAAQEPTPQEEAKVTLLSINTSSLSYDFTRARETGSGSVGTASKKAQAITTSVGKRRSRPRASTR